MGSRHRNLMPEWKKEKAVVMRKNPTTSEGVVWEKLRRRQINGFKFVCQHPALGYIADFYCSKLKLLIELDGKFHQKISDSSRDSHFEKHGFLTLRFPSSKAFSDLDGLIEDIRKGVISRARELKIATTDERQGKPISSEISLRLSVLRRIVGKIRAEHLRFFGVEMGPGWKTRILKIRVSYEKLNEFSTIFKRRNKIPIHATLPA